MTPVILSMILAALGALSCQAVSQTEFKEKLKANLKSVGEPMLALMSPERAKAMRTIVGECRTQPAFGACQKGEKSQCPIAMSCLMQDSTELKWTAPNAPLIQQRYKAVSKNFHSKLKGEQKHFAIGTMNAMIDAYNKLNTEVLRMSVETGQSVMQVCKDPEPKNAVTCSYDYWEKRMVLTADLLEKNHDNLKKLIDDELMSRIDAFPNSKK